jgi:ELWxxDGT repeat protein
MGRELLAFDPATRAMTLVRDIRPGTAGSSPSQLVAEGQRAFFTADDGVAGPELWLTDGTTAGTRMVLDLQRPGAGSPVDLTAMDGYVLFVADDGVHGRELWRSDGTTGGTILLADAFPGAGNGIGAPQITPIGGGQAVFVAAADATDRELWVTDGTPAGTRLLADLNRGSAGSNPTMIALAGSMLFLEATIGGRTVTVRFELAGGVRFGHGCPGTGGRVAAIDSFGGAPRIGNADFGISLGNARPVAPAILLLDLTSMPLQIGGCTLFVLPLVTFGAVTDAVGSARFPLPLPDDPSVVGVDLFGQWAVVDPAGSLFGALALSDALRVTLER